jgi:DNA-binding NtrC family response regulator
MSTPFDWVALVKPFQRDGENLLQTVERLMLESALVGRSQAEAAEYLGLTGRTINHRLKNFGMRPMDAEVHTV